MERIQLEEARNKVESYIYYIRNKLSDDEDAIGKVSTEDQREACLKLAEAAEDWMYDDGSTADLATLEDKYAEISDPAEKIFSRVVESHARPEAILALQEKLIKVEELMKKWETTHPQVTEEERGEVLTKVEAVKAWIKEKEAEQAEKKPHEEPAFASADVPLQTKSVESLVKRLSRKPKPKAEKKNATDANATEANATEADATEADATDATGDESDKDEKGNDSQEDSSDNDDSKSDKKTDDEL